METEKKREVIVRYAHELDYYDNIVGGKKIPFIADDPTDPDQMYVLNEPSIINQLIVGDLSTWKEETLDEYLTNVDFPEIKEMKYKPYQPIHKVVSLNSDMSECAYRYFFDGTQPTKRILFSTPEEAVAHRKKNHPEEFESPDD